MCANWRSRHPQPINIKKTINQLVGGVPLVARISRKTEVPSALTLRVEVKEPTLAVTTLRDLTISILLPSELGEEVYKIAAHNLRGAPSNT